MSNKNHRPQSQSNSQSQPANTSDSKVESSQVEDTDVASSVNSEAASSQGVAAGSDKIEKSEAAGKQAKGMKKDSNQAEASGQAAGADKGEDKVQSIQQGLGAISLTDILPNMDSESIAGFGERVLTYAEEKPLQTIGIATAAGALVGWLLTSKQGHSILRTSASIASPFVSNLISGRPVNAQEQTGANLKH